ncbi:MAG: serine hydrolase, partial [Pirellula sp.]
SAFVHPRHFAAGREAFLRKWNDPDFRKEVRQEMESSDGWENWYRNVNRDWGRVIIGQTSERRYTEQLGQSIAKIAEIHKEDPWETFASLVRASAFALPQSMSEANKVLALQQDFISFCTDVGPDNGSLSASHPRAYGSFPKLISRYVRELGVITLEQLISQASAVAANEIFAYDRGKIAEGLAADLVLFDLHQMADLATFTAPKTKSQGVRFVFVNGTVVLDDGKYTDKRPGRVLRGPGYGREHTHSGIATGDEVLAFHAFEKAVREFIDEHRIPGASIAVTKNDRILYSRGFGFSDLGKRDPVQPDSLFRIASISKPITAVAIMQLVELGKLKLDAPVLSVLDYETQIQNAGDSFDPRFRQITIEHLLQHRGGWDRDKSFDAMFQSVRFAEQNNVPPPAGPQQVILAMLKQKLDFEPGERYAYSNFGYCLLGRVIEKLSGLSYEKYVQERILKPIGVHSMRIGASRLAGRAANEVRYYHPGTGKSVFQSDLGEEVPWPYGGWNLEAMDSHGGWIASANDLARFAIAIRSPNSPLLSPESIEHMHRRPSGLAGYDEAGKPKEVYYSLGWQNRELRNGEINHWHTGSLAGTATILIRLHHGCDIVALFNSRTSPNAEHLGRAADTILGKAIRLVDLSSVELNTVELKTVELNTEKK